MISFINALMRSARTRASSSKASASPSSVALRFVAVLAPVRFLPPDDRGLLFGMVSQPGVCGKDALHHGFQRIARIYSGPLAKC